MQVLVGGESEFSGLIYGDKHPGTMRFLQSQIGNAFSSTLTDMGKQMFSNLGSIFEKFNGENALRLAKAARRKVTGFFEQEVIRPLWDIKEIQQATLTMQRWIMAYPEIRELYHDQRCDGYSATYVDMFPGQIGEKHYDYRRVMDGLVQVTDEGESKIVYYYDDPPADDVELSLQDKIDITNTWQMIARHLKHTNDDPTSIFGDTL